MRLFYIVFLMVIFSAGGVNAQSRLAAFRITEPPATLRFYPNPATSFITFEDILRKYDKNYTIQIFNFLGKKVYEFSLN